MALGFGLCICLGVRFALAGGRLGPAVVLASSRQLLLLSVCLSVVSRTNRAACLAEPDEVSENERRKEGGHRLAIAERGFVSICLTAQHNRATAERELEPNGND